MHPRQKNFFQCIELRDLVDVQTKRDYPGDERVIKTKYGSELTIFLFSRLSSLFVTLATLACKK